MPHPRISLVIPALNEAQAISNVIYDFRQLTYEDDDGNPQPLINEIIVCDNGSTDSTKAVALKAGAQVVTEEQRGYGNACLKALSTVNSPDIVLFVDSDHAFYADQAKYMIRLIQQGFDLVIGSRALGKMEKGALTPPQLFGNKLACYLIEKIWNYKVSDLGPFRAIRYSSLEQLHMQDKTFGWTIEMQIKAIQRKLFTIEVPVNTRKRIGQSKISGTLKGVIGAGVGIIGMIIKLRWKQQRNTFKNRGTNTPTSTSINQL